MRKHILIAFFAMLSLTVLNNKLRAQSTEASFKVSGEVTTPLTITAADLHQFPQTTVIRKDKDGNDHTYSGVLLSDILKKAGATMGAELKGKNLTKYLLIEASDNYHVVFALAELDKNFTDRMIILTDQIDGKPLPSSDGPFRVIVQDEKKPARCIRQVISMKVVAAN